MATKDAYDKIEEMDIPQEAKNILKDRQVEKEYEGYQKQKKAPEKPKSDKSSSGTTVKKARGGSVKSSASKRADGCAQRGKTKGRMV